MDRSWENFYYSLRIIQIFLKFSHASHDSVYSDESCVGGDKMGFLF